MVHTFHLQKKLILTKNPNCLYILFDIFICLLATLRYATQHYVYSPLWNWAFLTQIDLKKLFIRNTAQIHQKSIQFCNALKNTLFWPILVGNPSISSFSQQRECCIGFIHLTLLSKFKSKLCGVFHRIKFIFFRFLSKSKK